MPRLPRIDPWQSSRQPGRGKTWAVAVAIGVIFLAGLWLWLLGQKSAVSTDPVTLCRTDHPPSEIVVFLLDLSDEFTEAQRIDVLNRVRRIQSGVGKFGLVQTYAVTGTVGIGTALFEMCNPGSGSDLNTLYQNPGLAKKKWEKFSTDLDAHLRTLMSSRGAAASPIMEAVQASALRTFNQPQFADVPKRLVVVSDLLQYVPGRVNQYEVLLPFDQFAGMSYFSEVRADLEDIEVTLLYLVRPRSPQPWPAHRLFWEAYFRAQGAEVDRIEPIFGGR